MYYVGCCVCAAQPPFSIQLISEAPLVGRDFYDEPLAQKQMNVVWPAGLLLEISIDRDNVISYGKDDNQMRAVLFDRRKLMQTLQAPVPENWEEPPC